MAGSKRHPARLVYRLGAGADGTFQALDVRLHYDTGPYDHLGGAIMALGLEHAGGPYRIPHVSLKSWAVYTNNPLSGAFRGFGVPQVTGAMEQMVDLMADKLGIDKLEIRLQNALRPRRYKPHRGDPGQFDRDLRNVFRPSKVMPYGKKGRTGNQRLPNLGGGGSAWPR